MAYARLNSPLPNMTMPFHPGAHAFLRGCPACGLGDESLDPSAIDLPLPTIDDPILIDPVYEPPMDIYTAQPSTDAPWIGDVFQNVGPDEYLNIQTGQVVPSSVANEIAAATAGASSIAQTTGTEVGVNLTDPATGTTYTGALTQAAQALKAAGTLVDAAGHLTAQGRALAASGQLVSAPISPTSSISSALSSFTSWFSQQSLIAGLPNWALVAGVLVGGPMLLGSFKFRKSRGRR